MDSATASVANLRRGGRAGMDWSRAAAMSLMGLALASGGCNPIRASASTAAGGETVPVQRGALIVTTSARGTIVAGRQAEVSFGTAGRVEAVRVSVGQNVSTGQVLATVESHELEARLEQARSELRIAMQDLQEASQGAAPEEVAAAEAALAAGQAKIEELAAGSPTSAMQAAEAEVGAAEAVLAGARARRQQLETSSPVAERAAAEQAMVAARASLQKAESELAKLEAEPTDVDLEVARLEVDRAKQSVLARKAESDAALAEREMELKIAQLDVDKAREALAAAKSSKSAACNRDDGDPACQAGSAQIRTAELAVQQAELKLQHLQASRAGAESIAAPIRAAELAVQQAELKLQQLEAGPRPEELAAAEQSVVAARQGVESAEVRRRQVLSGPIEVDLQVALSAERSAEAALRSAQAKLEQVRAGAKASELRAAEAEVAKAAALAANTSPAPTKLAKAEERVRQAELNVARAESALDGAVLRAPFDGVVAAVAINPGEQAWVGRAAVTLEDPRAVRVNARMDEAEAVKLVPGQEIRATFEALGGREVGGSVVAVSPIAAPEQESTTYLVSADLTPEDIRLTPGMTAVLSAVVERKDDVLLVPNRTLRRQGQEPMVEVLVDGRTEVRQVRLGISNAQFTEITDGLAEGERVLRVR